MKIRSSLPTSQLNAMESQKRATKRTKGSTSQPATRVQLSTGASQIASLQREATDMPAIREDAVAAAKAALANGTLDQSVDMDDVVDGLVADL